MIKKLFNKFFGKHTISKSDNERLLEMVLLKFGRFYDVSSSRIGFEYYYVDRTVPHGLNTNKRHRRYGPAVIYDDGEKQWWYNGQHINCTSQEEFERLIKLDLFW